MGARVQWKGSCCGRYKDVARVILVPHLTVLEEKKKKRQHEKVDAFTYGLPALAVEVKPSLRQGSLKLVKIYAKQLNFS